MSTLEAYTLTTLTDSVKESASILHKLLTQHHLPQPDFLPTGRRDWSDAQTLPDVLNARSNLIDAPQTLLNLALGPADTLAVPFDDEISISDLASKMGVKNVPALGRQLGFAYLMGMFRQTEDGMVAHTGTQRGDSRVQLMDRPESLGQGATVVDVGGGNGHIEAGIARLIPDVDFVIQDRPSNEEPARQLIEQHGLAGRVQFQAHDFFAPQPALPGPRTASAYLLVRVLQDWADADCARILKPLVACMEKSGAKLWTMNRILLGVGELPNHREKLLRTLDLLVFNLSGGGERSAVDFERMLGQADERLMIKKVIRPLSSLFSFIEVVLE
ncbi:O-methyltransferase-domain-containing protein [Xylariaceae sp. FL1651]|nr:O-methyltransferase-domain-containing protein [Xylariaceae sp. FL1651]